MKKPIIGFAVTVVVLTTLAVGARVWLTDEKKAMEPTARTMAGNTPGAPLLGPSLNSEQTPAGLTAPPAPTPTGTDSPLLPLAPSTTDAAVSMAQAMKNGDPRAPAVVHDAPQEMATPEEIADPKLYAQYEARQNLRLYKGYIKAAEVEIPRLQQDIEKAKKMGLPAAQIAEGEEKLRRIMQMRDQLASEHPEAVK